MYEARQPSLTDGCSRTRGRGGTTPRTRVYDPADAGRRATEIVGSEVDGDVLGLEVLLDALVAALATEAGLLDAAERCAGVGHHPLVESDHAGLESLDDAQRPL